jgi:hypothetical protein
LQPLDKEISMATCDCCGADYFPSNASWDACGDCFASGIELLLQASVAGARKPMVRVGTSAAAAVPADAAPGLASATMLAQRAA